MLGEDLGNPETVHGRCGLCQSVTQCPPEAAADDPVLDADDGVVTGSHANKALREGQEPARVDHGDADSICRQAAAGLDRVGRAGAGSDDEHLRARLGPGLVEEDIHSPVGAQRGHRVGQGALAVAQDRERVVDVEGVAQLGA